MAGQAGTGPWQILAVQSEYCKVAPCVYIHVHTCMYTQAHTCTYTQAHTCTFVHTHACTCSRVHIQMHSHAHRCKHAHIHAHSQPHAGAQAYVHRHICTHMYPCTPPRTLPGPALPPRLGDRAMPHTGQQSIQGDLGPGSPWGWFPPMKGSTQVSVGPSWLLSHAGAVPAPGHHSSKPLKA